MFFPPVSFTGKNMFQGFNLRILFKAIFLFQRVLLITENPAKEAFYHTSLRCLWGFIDIHSRVDHRISQGSTVPLPPPSVVKLQALQNL